MVKQIFETIEAMFRAVTYLLILLIGLVVVGLGTYTILFLAIRSAQLLWCVLFREKWG